MVGFRHRLLAHRAMRECVRRNPEHAAVYFASERYLSRKRRGVRRLSWAVWFGAAAVSLIHLLRETRFINISECLLVSAILASLFNAALGRVRAGLGRPYLLVCGNLVMFDWGFSRFLSCSREKPIYLGQDLRGACWLIGDSPVQRAALRIPMAAFPNLADFLSKSLPDGALAPVARSLR